MNKNIIEKINPFTMVLRRFAPFLTNKMREGNNIIIFKGKGRINPKKVYKKLFILRLNSA